MGAAPKTKAHNLAVRAFELVPVFVDQHKYTLQWPNRLATRHPLSRKRLWARHPLADRAFLLVPRTVGGLTRET